MEWVNAKDFPEEMANTVKNIDSALCEIEKLVAEMTSTPLAEAHSLLTPLEKSKYDTASVYAVTSLFWAYMKTSGLDPKTNGLPKELERVKNAVVRAKQIADKVLAPKVDVSAAKRFVRSGLWGPKGDEKPTETSPSLGEKITPPPSKKIRIDGPSSSSHIKRFPEET